MTDHVDRETLTKFHQPDRRLAEVQDRERKAGSERERREIRRNYYREVRAEHEAAGEGRKYADRRDMANTGRPDKGAQYGLINQERQRGDSDR
jgi:hypothetical protein